ncbi:MAG TPA: VanW family protein [Candidatus Saccharimonadales bacterium]|nr:VanW family protein [Candidatus Saccharimonadales bacterium]
MKKKFPIKKRHLYFLSKGLFWFTTGGILALFFLISFTFIFFQRLYAHAVYPGVIVYGVDFGGKTPEQVESYFTEKNNKIKNTTFTISADSQIATLSAEQLQMGYDSKLLATQAYSIGRSPDVLSNIVLIFQANVYGVHLSPAYKYNSDLLSELVTRLAQKVYKAPVDAVFTMQNNRVSAFKPSENGQAGDIDAVKQKISSYVPFILSEGKIQQIRIIVPIRAIKPKVTTDSVGHYGIRDLIGEGTSLFQHSAPERIYNVTLAASRVNGVLVAPNEQFSFDKALGDVSQFTGYKQAYVIQNGKTVLGDGGGVCQVSTTFFRALLNAGLPITERHAHAYRVGYYEEGGFQPGIDATVYVPTVDLKFKNDTGHWILVQTILDPNELRLTIDLYGVKDDRIATVSTPVITNQTPAPEALYQDDPTLPVGTVKQVDFAAPGATSIFTRTVTKDGKVLYNDKFVSDYKPWQAIFLRGTKT